MQDPLAQYFQEDDPPPKIDPLARYFEEEDSSVPLPSKINKFERGVSKGFEVAGKGTASVLGGLGKAVEMFGKKRSGFSDLADVARKTSEKYKKVLEENPANTLGEKATEVVGTIAGTHPFFRAVGGPIEAGGGYLAARVASPLAKQLLGSTTVALAKGTSARGVAARLALSRAPMNVATGVATEAVMNPENVSTLDRLKNVSLMSATGSLVDGLVGAYQFRALSKMAVAEAGRIAKKAKDVEASEQLLGELKSRLDEALEMATEGQLKITERSGGLAGMRGELFPKRITDLHDPLGPDVVRRRVAEAVQRSYTEAIEEAAAGAKPSIFEPVILNGPEPDVIEKAAAKGIAERIAALRGPEPPIQAQQTKAKITQGSANNPSVLNSKVTPITHDLPPMIGGPDQRRAIENLGVEGSVGTSGGRRGLSYDELKGYHDLLSSLKGTQKFYNVMAFRRLEAAFQGAIHGKVNPDGTVDPSKLSIEDLEKWSDQLYAFARRLQNGYDADIPKTPFSQASPNSANALRHTTGLDIPTSKGSIPVDANPDATLLLEDPTVNNYINRLVRSSAGGGKGAKSVENNFFERPIPGIAPDDPALAKQAANTYDTSLKRVQSRIDYTPTTPTRWQKVQEFFKNFRQEVQDSKWAVAKMEKSAGVADPVIDPNSAYNAFELLAGAGQEADLIANLELRLPRLTDGKWRGETDVLPGMAPKKIIDKVGISRLPEFDSILLAYRRLSKAITDPKNKQARLDATGAIKSGIDEQDAQTIINNAPEDLKKLAMETQNVAKWAREYLFRAGLKSEAALKAMEEGGFYTSFGRVLDQTWKSNPLRPLLGSDRAFRSPSQNMYDNVLFVVERAKKNMAWNRILDLQEAKPEALEGWIQPWSQSSENFTMDAVNKIADEMRKNGADVTDTAVSDVVRFFLSGRFDASNKTVNIFRDGKLLTYKVNPQLERMVNSLSPGQMGPFTAISSYLESTVRASTSIGYDLSLLGFISDSAEAAQTVPKFIPILDSMRGAWHSLLKTDAWREKTAANAGFGGRWMSAEQATRFKVAADGSIKKVHSLKSPLEYVVHALRPLSEAARMGAYLRMKDNGASVMEAALMSRRIGGDWGQVGASVQPLAQATAFFNVGIQTSTQAARAIARASKDPKYAAQLIAAGVGTITLPTLGLYFNYIDDDDINDLRKAPGGYKNWYWRAPFDINLPGEELDVKKGDIMQMPVPGWALGSVFSAPLVAGLDSWRDQDPEGLKRLGKTMVDQLGFNTIPVWFQTVIGLSTNSRNVSPFNTNTRTPIVPGSQAGLLPEAQGDERTSGLARTLAPKLGISPFKFDYAIERLGGSEMGRMMRMLTHSDGQPELRKADLPFAGRYFSRYPAGQGEAVEAFYRDIETFRRVKKSMDTFNKSGQVGEMEELLDNPETEEAFTLLPQYERVYSYMTEQMGKINTITRLPSNIMDAKEKRELIDDIRQQMIERVRGIRGMAKSRK